eukprot:CAMPEP_0168320994 /NCGR_PEP_ID=MMETSP0213-20121227/2005_1 /TAXON_ID=151035 /ORGANISM="Euplotes harpa, Strain FSP1.4" /LENGTH=166 /DNA_ID=CAMNT_0008322557 /DNA_START=156 /DNA_END=656 /DNA_ORIENTATION=-
MEKFYPSVIQPLWTHIQENFSEEIKERLEYEKALKKFKESQIKVTIVYGNTYKMLKHFVKNRKGLDNKHQWKVYVKPKENIRSSLLIKKVVFYMHESFSTTDIVKKTAPFEYSMITYKSFEFPIQIEWQDWLNKKPTIVNHWLSFNKREQQKFITLTVNKEILEEH